MHGRERNFTPDIEIAGPEHERCSIFESSFGRLEVMGRLGMGICNFKIRAAIWSTECWGLRERIPLMYGSVQEADPGIDCIDTGERDVKTFAKNPESPRPF